MYIPAHFVNNNSDEVLSFVRANSFAVLVTAGLEVHASHIPLELSDDGSILSGHLSKANAQAKSLKDGDKVLCVFNGPHAYVSSSWYNHENVPTWNYIAVHIRGTIRLITGDALIARLSEIVDKYEEGSKRPVSVKGMSHDYLARHLKGIIGFDIDISSVEAAYKLSQNRDAANHENIVKELELRGDYNSSSVALEMKKRAPKA